MFWGEGGLDAAMSLYECFSAASVFDQASKTRGATSQVTGMQVQANIGSLLTWVASPDPMHVCRL